MKRILILFCIISFIMVGCTKDEFEPIPITEVKSNIFDGDESTISNGQLIKFNLPNEGFYILTIQSENNGDVISRERFNGKLGLNELNIYTNVLNISRFDLILSDDNGNVVDRVLITKK